MSQIEANFLGFSEAEEVFRDPQGARQRLSLMKANRKMYRLIGADGRPCLSEKPGTLGGHRRLKGYGRLDCPSALRWIAKGHYVRNRVFFADEATAIAAGYRPCARCMPEAYRLWKEREIKKG